MRPIHHCLMSIALLAALVQQPLAAQAPTEKLLDNIVHITNAHGMDEYRDVRTPSIQDTSICFLYITRLNPGGPLMIRLQVRYSDFRRLNLQQVVFRKDDRQLVVEIMPELLHHGDNGMVQWEWYDTPPSETEMRAIHVMINEPGVTVSMIGRETVTRTLSDTERLVMQNILAQFNILAHSPR